MENRNEPNEARMRARRLHPLPLRLMHWLNALAMLMLIGSGWTIYNAQPVVPAIRFPEWLTMGGDPEISFRLNGDGGYGGALQWHFAAMWLLVLNGLAYLGYGIATGRFRRKFFPIRPADVAAEIAKALRFDLGHADITLYNAVQKLLYVGVILVIILQVAAGLALWKPVQFSNLVWLMGGFQGVRMVHFLGMGAIVGFLVIHVLLALIVPRTIAAMVTGGPRIIEKSTAASEAGTIPVATQGQPS
nr:cytochrome b/b6 domain-containing protein [Bosea sp. PAMC 26642]